MSQTNSTLKRVSSPPRAWLGLLVLLCLAALLATRLPRVSTINANYVGLNRALSDGSAGGLAALQQELAMALATYPQSADLLRAQALALSAGRTQPPSAAAWRSYPAAAQEIDGWASRAEMTKDWAEADYWLALLVALEPNSADAWYRYGRVLTQRNQRQAAQQAYQHGLAAVGQAGQAGAFAGDFLLRLGELARQGDNPDWTAAHDLFAAAIERDTFSSADNRAAAYMGRAEAADRLGWLGEAFADYLWVAERQPNNYWAHTHGGRLAWYAAHDAAQATSLLQRAIAIDAANQWAYVNLAQVYARTGQTERAIAILEGAMPLVPQNAGIQTLLEQLRAGQ